MSRSSTPSPYLALSPIVATVIYAVTATADGCIAHYQLITADQRIHRHHSAPHRVATHRVVWEKYRNETKQEGTVSSPYIYRVKPESYRCSCSHQRNIAVLLHSHAFTMPASLTWRWQNSSQINSFLHDSSVVYECLTWKKFFVEIFIKFR